MELTILADIPDRAAIGRARRLLRNLLGQQVLQAGLNEHRGPVSVERNLLKGFGQIGQPYRLNPPTEDFTPYVGVLSSIEGLKRTIGMKRRGEIEWLVAGPNLVISPDQHDRLLESVEIDRVVVPCDWTKHFYGHTSPSIKPRLRVWSSGVDETYWTPDSRQDTALDFLIYRKADNRALLTTLLELLDKNRLTHHTIEYGRYLPADYRALLRSSRFMAFLSESESQGIALFEAWACDVPTLVWDRGYWRYPDGPYEWFGASSAPYLTATCGLSFKDADDLPGKLDRFLERAHSYDPRGSILARHTLAHSAGDYLKLFQQIRLS
jgi:hypothetical protein